MMGYGAGLGFGLGGWLGMIGMILLAVGVVALLVWLVTRASAGTQAVAPPAAYGPPPAPPAGPDPVELLRVRFARGEITQEEFLAAKQVLEAGR